MNGAIGVIEFGVGGFDHQFAAVGHGVARIHRQVHDDLFHLAGVGANDAQVRAGLQHQFDVFANQARQKLAHFFHDAVDVHHAGLKHLHAAEGEELASQRRGAIGGAIDLFDFFCGLGGNGNHT